MKIQNPKCRSRFFASIGIIVISAATVRADYQSTILGDNPLAYYALNPNADPAGVAPDLTGNGNDGVAVNTTGATGPSTFIPNAANFNGASSINLSLGSNPNLLDFTGPITLEAWAQPSSSSLFADIVAKGYDSTTYQEIVIRVNGPYGANYYASSGTTGVSGGVQNTNWTHVVMSSNGTNCSLYVNGVLVQQSADTTGSVQFANDWKIGNGSSGGNGRLFNGNICQVAIYNHGLTASQVLNHYYIGLLNSSASTSAPIISTQPQPQQGFVGGPATFSVSSVSALPTTNQWFKGGSPLAGKTNSTLVLNNLQLSDAGNYSVVVGNANGTTNSVSASLSVSIPANLKWSSAGNSGTWDTGTSANWINLANSQQVVFNSGDQVLFDDTVGVPTAVTLGGTILPSVITVDSSANSFNFSSGSISGPASLVKKGSSTLTITSAGDVTGPVTSSGGTVYAGNNAFKSVSSLSVTNATLDFGGGSYSTGQPITVSGTGVNGAGALFNSYDSYPSEVYNMILAGNTTFGASKRWDLGAGSQITGPYSITIDWSAGSGYGEWNTVSVGANVVGITLTNGNMGMKNMDTTFQNPATLFTVSTNCEFTFWSGGFNGSLRVLSGGRVNLYTAPSAFNGSSIILEQGANWFGFYNSGDESINSAVTLNGVAHFLVGDHNLIYTNLISGPGGFVVDAYNHQLVFSSANTYSGPTVIGDGPQVALTGNGSISHSSPIFFGGNNATSVHIDVSGRSDQTLTLASGQTLAGVGRINGNLTVAGGAVVAPAGTNTTIDITTGANVTGTISAANAVVLSGTTSLKLNGSGVNDSVQAGTSITYGGTLNLVNVSGSPLVAGNSFQVFTATTYAGSFASITPATPGAGLAWDTSQLNIGFLNVVASGGSGPVINHPTVSGGNLIFTGTGGTPNGSYSVLTTTNIATPVINWVSLTTNNFDALGNFSVTNAIAPGTPQCFYRIKQ